jgi:tRNA pseudouridine38-40 synthase
LAESIKGSQITLIIEYDGTNYHGSQFQTNAPTVQEEIEKALEKLTGKKIRIKMASRTDAGVHATGQVAGFITDSALPLESYVEGLNHFLPDDIAVREAFASGEPFDVRRRATSREYRYSILNRATRSPVKQRFTHRVAGELDIDAMNEACRALIGKKDLTSFVSSAEVAAKKRTVRRIMKAEFTREADMIHFDIVADSFMPHQVRNTIGALIKVGQGKTTINEFEKMIEAKTPGLAGPTAPAAGLCLVRVNYPEPLGR